MSFNRFTVCLVVNHKWTKVPHSQHEGTEKYLRCRRCGHEDHDSWSTIGTAAPSGY